MNETTLHNPGDPRQWEPRFRYDVQGLRAIAILLVVLCHSNVPFFASGFIGVDVFFVLSGYLITLLLVRERQSTGKISFSAFYARRLRRLLPALAVMLGGTGCVALLLLSDGEVQRQLVSAPYAATWTSNIYFAFAEVDYFDELAAWDVFLHTWSLGVEEQFYLIWPPVILLTFLAGSPQGTAARRAAAPVLIGFVSLASFGAAVYWTMTAPTSAYYMMPSRIWQFGLGGLLCFIPVERILTSASARAITILGLAMILGTAVLLPLDVAYPGFWGLIPSLGAALVISAGHGRAGAAVDVLAHPALVWLGDRSYSWYLWHWPVLVIGFSLGLDGQPLSVSALVLLSLLAAMASYKYVELPFWKGRYRGIRPRPAILAGVMVMALTVAGLFHGVRALTDPVPGSASWRADLPIIYRMGCDQSYAGSQVKPCVFGTDEAARTAILVGDSIGAQWFSAVRAAFAEPHWRTIVLTKSACAMVDVEYVHKDRGEFYEACTAWRNAVITELATLEPDVVVVGSSPHYDLTQTQWTAGSARIFERLADASKSVFVIVGTPRLAFNGPGCVSRNLLPDREAAYDACISTTGLEDAQRVSEYLRAAANPFARVHLLDFNDLVCPDGICSAVTRRGMVVFRDSKHLTDTFVRAQANVIRERFTATGEIPALPQQQVASGKRGDAKSIVSP